MAICPWTSPRSTSLTTTRSRCGHASWPSIGGPSTWRTAPSSASGCSRRRPGSTCCWSPFTTSRRTGGPCGCCWKSSAPFIALDVAVWRRRCPCPRRSTWTSCAGSGTCWNRRTPSTTGRTGMRSARPRPRRSSFPPIARARRSRETMARLASAPSRRSSRSGSRLWPGARGPRRTRCCWRPSTCCSTGTPGRTRSSSARPASAGATVASTRSWGTSSTCCPCEATSRETRRSGRS